jgi:hypothetical protein
MVIRLCAILPGLTTAGSGVQPMLQKLGDHIANCIARAEECREAAAAEPDARVRSQLLNLETQWLHVAKSYEFIASLEIFLVDAQKRTLPFEVEKLPKGTPDD